MGWKKKKPTESGWYRYVGDLYAIGERGERIHCDPACRVAVHSGEEPFIALYEDTRIYDFESADGLWSKHGEKLERPALGELPGE